MKKSSFFKTTQLKLSPKLQNSFNKKRKISFIIMLADFAIITIILLIVLPKISTFRPIDYKNYQFESKAVEFSEKTLIEFSSKQMAASTKDETITVKFNDKNGHTLLSKDLTLSSTQKLSIEDFIVEQTGLKTLELAIYNQDELIKTTMIKVRK